MRRFVALTAALAVTAAAAAPLPVAGAVGASPTAKFVAKANAACDTAAGRVEHLPKVTKKNVAHVLATEAGILASLTKRLRGIDAPQAQAKRYRQLVAATALQPTLIRSALKAAKKDKAEKAATYLEQAVAAGDRGHALARGLGLDACVRDFTPGVG